MRRAQLAVVIAVLAVLVAPIHASGAQPRIDAAAWYLVGDDGSVLARSSAARARAIASITKVMTAAVVLEEAELTDVVRVPPRATGAGESSASLRTGEELTVAELVRAMLVPSGNDAADALALHVGDGSADRFVGLMNAKADELGLSDTNFENAHGLDEPGHVSSARDATALMRYALGIPFLRDAMSRETVTLPGERTLTTTDDLLGAWAPLLAGKTGHTLDAGWSQAAAAEKPGVTVYGTVLGSDSRSARNDALRELLSYGLAQYRRVQVLDHGRVYALAETGYDQRDVELTAPRSVVRTLRTGKQLVERVVAPASLTLPVAAGAKLGRVDVYDGDRLVASSDLVAAEAVPDAGLLAKAKWYLAQTARNLWGIVS
jgi:serine-type D-Ala-D-Ala carboxypeptidase (penicillin-binding protein 5/6)